MSASISIRPKVWYNICLLTDNFKQNRPDLRVSKYRRSAGRPFISITAPLRSGGAGTDGLLAQVIYSRFKSFLQGLVHGNDGIRISCCDHISVAITNTNMQHYT